MQDSITDISLSNQYHQIQQKKRNLISGRRMPSFPSISHNQPTKSSNPPSPSSNNEAELSLTNLISQNNRLQVYVKQLVDYINDASSKYSQNIQKYGIAYKELFISNAHLQQSSSQQILLLRNEMQSQRQVLLSKSQQAIELDKKVKALKQQVQEQRNRSRNIKQQMEAQWQQQQNSKNLWNQILIGIEEESKQYKQEIFDVKNENKSKDIELNQLRHQITKLKQSLQDRQDLPYKIIQLQKQMAVDSTSIHTYRIKIDELQKQNDLLKLQLLRSQKEREQLRVKNTEISTDFDSYFVTKFKDIEAQWKDKQFSHTLQISRLQQRCQQLKAELNSQAQQLSQQYQLLESKQRQISQLNKRVKSQIDEKQSYLSEFKVLKCNYQDIINNLETTVDQLQHKFWVSSDKNRQMEFQVDKFRDLAKQLQQVNDRAGGATDILKQEVQERGLGDPYRLLRGQEDYKQAQQYATSKASFFKDKKEDLDEDDPWGNLMDKINSM